MSAHPLPDVGREEVLLPLDEAVGFLQPLLLRPQAAPEVGGRHFKGVLGPPAVLRAHPAPGAGGECRAAGLGTQGAGLA